MTPDRYARDLLQELGQPKPVLPVIDDRTESTLWAQSGAQYLTGEPGGAPLPSPAPLATCARGCWLALCEAAPDTLDPNFAAHQLLGERAALLGLQRRGSVSPGGACRLLQCSDGWIAVNLPREDDWRLLPAWLECDADSWETLSSAVRGRPGAELVSRARLLGLAATVSQQAQAVADWFFSQRLAAEATPPAHAPLVLDLSTIWAGPLCAHLLGEMGARVIKVESTSRPDGTRAGSPEFFDLLNGGKESVALDLGRTTGRAQLLRLLNQADIIVESARPRGLQQMGIRAEDIVAAGTGKVWLSVTGYGRKTPMGEWIAYGDDAGVTAGLSALLEQTTGRHVFVGDAIADPLTGMHAALLAMLAWTRGGGVLLDVPLTGVLARCIGSGDVENPTAEPATDIFAPRARTPASRTGEFGSDTAAILSEFDIS